MRESGRERGSSSARLRVGEGETTAAERCLRRATGRNGNIKGNEWHSEAK